MADAAQAADVRSAIGLQLRANAAVRKARSLITDGRIGRLLSANVYSATAGFGPDVAAPFAYLEDPANFANLVTIQAAHTIDLVTALTGAFESLGALATAQYPVVRVGDDHVRRSRSTFDHLLVQASTAGGATAAIEVAGGRPSETPFRLEVFGEDGILRLEGGAGRGVQSGSLTLFVDGQEQPVEQGAGAGTPDAAINVAATYAALRDDILHGTKTVVGFDHAVRLTRLIEDTLASSHQGCRTLGSGWPAA